MNLRNIFICSLVAMLMAANSYAQISREQYIEQYKQLALDSQREFGIPASIKMAQALLESSNGNSRLAVQANNHFGIKCKSYWRGETITHDDDAVGECFRKYPSAEESFADHSKFLSEGERYSFLFSIPTDDYESWAHGLKQAGYATNPQYAYLLIDIIEKNNLQNLAQAPKPQKVEIVEQPVVETTTSPAKSKFNINDYAIYKKQKGSHTVYINNNSLFVVMFEGETLESLAENIGIKVSKLRRYNDLKSYETIEAGEMVYIKAKKNSARNGTQYHAIKKGESLHSVSQLYAIKLSKLCDINKKNTDMELPEGMRLRLK